MEKNREEMQGRRWRNCGAEWKKGYWWGRRSGVVMMRSVDDDAERSCCVRRVGGGDWVWRYWKGYRACEERN